MAPAPSVNTRNSQTDAVAGGVERERTGTERDTLENSTAALVVVVEQAIEVGLTTAVGQAAVAVWVVSAGLAVGAEAARAASIQRSRSADLGNNLS